MGENGFQETVMASGSQYCSEAACGRMSCRGLCAWQLSHARRLSNGRLEGKFILNRRMTLFSETVNLPASFWKPPTAGIFRCWELVLTLDRLPRCLAIRRQQWNNFRWPRYPETPSPPNSWTGWKAGTSTNRVIKWNWLSKVDVEAKVGPDLRAGRSNQADS